MPLAKLHVLEGQYDEARLGKVSSAVQNGLISALGVVGDLIGEGSAQDQSVVGETPNLAAWPPPRDRAGDIDPNYRRSPKLARQNFRRSNRARQVCKDSPLEGDGFEPSVPRSRSGDFRFPKVERV
jgi:hypothetical protein